MHAQVNRLNLISFYTGTFISQLGSYVFIFGMLFFPPVSGWSHFQTGCLLSVGHLFGAIGILRWGDMGDRVEPKKLIVIVELIACMMSLGLIITWQMNHEVGRWFFILFAGLRALAVSIQAPARNKYLKLISTSNQASKSLSIWLTSITQGTAIFSSLLCLYFFKQKTFTASIIFDACSFVINGALLLTMPTIAINATAKKKIKERVKDYFSVDSFLSFKDVFASIAITGVSILMVRLSSQNQELTFILGGLFGLSFWAGGAIFHRVKNEKLDHYVWFLYALSYLALSFANTDMLRIVFLGAVFLCYAILMQKYVSEWQHHTPLANVSSVFSIRTIILTVTLGAGELIMGKMSSFISLQHELQGRFVLALILALIIVSKDSKRELK